jgi:Lon protease-like protein
MITLSGISRFRVQQEVDGLHALSPVRRELGGVSADSRGPSTIPASTAPFLDLLGRYFEALSLSTDWDSLKEAEDELLINSLSMLCPFDPEEKQALLEAPSLSTRRETLVTLLEFACAAGRPRRPCNERRAGRRTCAARIRRSTGGCWRRWSAR